MTTLFTRTLVIIFLTTSLFGCSAAPNATKHDPYEHINRSVFKFNQQVDHLALRPLARLYVCVTPAILTSSVSYFFQNLSEITNVLNDLLQLEFHHALHDTSRFVLNSTLGLAGIVDVANEFGLSYHYQDFGLTLNKWGIHNSNYIMLPFFGPYTVTSALGLPVDYMALSVWPYISNHSVLFGSYGLYVISNRGNLLPADELLAESFDPYVFVRNAYLQQRKIKEQKVSSHQSKSKQPA